MEWMIAACAVLVLAAAAIVGRGRWGSMPPVMDDRYPGMIPEGPIDGAGLRDTRFAVVTRGYSPAQVDDLLERVAQQLDRQVSASEKRRGTSDDLATPPRDEPELTRAASDSTAEWTPSWTAAASTGGSDTRAVESWPAPQGDGSEQTGTGLPQAMSDDIFRTPKEPE